MKRCYFFLLIFIWAACPAYGAVELSLEQAIEMALNNNESLKQAGEERISARERVKEARGAVFPTLGASYGYNHYFLIPDMTVPVAVAPATDSDGNLLGGDGQNPPGPDNPWFLMTQDFPAMNENEHVFSLTASQALFTSGRVRNYYRAAKAGSAGADYMYNRQRHQLILQVQEAYLNSLMAREALDIAQASLNNTLKDHEIISQKFKEGLGSEFELMQHEVEVNNRRTGLITAENNLTLAKNYLKVTIGIDLEEEIVLTDSYSESFPEFEFEEIRQAMLKDEPSLKALDKTVEASKYMLKAYKADFYPIVAAFGSLQYSGNSDQFIPESDDFSETLLAGIQVTIPIYEGGVKSAKKNRALRDLNKTELELVKIRKLLTLDLQNAYLAYLAARKEMDSARETVKLAEKAYDLAKLRYKTGLGNLTELQDAELALTQAKLLHSKTKRDVNLNLYKIQSYISDDSRSEQ
ncbi:MAG: TolC family protein [Deltaproteobacteria bacterium]|nr:MAG: TolC family protein [Deltaproteobacteria bacterium]